MERYEDIEKAAPLGAFSTLDMAVLVPEVEKIPEGGCYLEVGVDKGKSLFVARTVADESVEVCGVDLEPDPGVRDTRFIRGDSGVVSRDWAWGQIDVLFIDGDHSYFGCRIDIQGWYPYMRKGGVMLFHDCDESSPGVMQAVAEFVHSHKVKEFKVFKRTDINTSMAKIQLW